MMFSVGYHSHLFFRGNESDHLQIRNENREYLKKYGVSIFFYVLNI